MAADQLIISPLSLSFLAPLSHFQKRMLTMINASSEDVIFRIEIDNNIDYSVIPMRGKVNAFDTTELIVTLAPVMKDIPDCALAVRSIPLTMIAHIEEMEWNSTDVLIELDPRKALQLDEEPIKRHLQVDDLKKRAYHPKVSHTSHWHRAFLYVLGILSMIMAAYFSLKSKRIF
ncbi:hypothetical protein KR032_002397 [Drosophila birchii]|nr:hypothetical protein KR032_002397 [Drosophila birchii]